MWNADSGSNCGSSVTSTCSTSCPLVDSYDGQRLGRSKRLSRSEGPSTALRSEPTWPASSALVETDGRYRMRHPERPAGDRPLGRGGAARGRSSASETRSSQTRSASFTPCATRTRPRRVARMPAVGSATVGPVPYVTLVASADGQAVGERCGGAARRRYTPRTSATGSSSSTRGRAGAASALLVARVGATALGPRLLRRGAAPCRAATWRCFYASLEAQPSVREAFERARKREVLPTVRVFDGTAWRMAGYLRDLPSLVDARAGACLSTCGT